MSHTESCLPLHSKKKFYILDFYDRITRLGSLRNQGKKTKVLLAVGGWTDSAGDKYSKMVSDEGKRKDFVKSSIEFLKRYRFSGLHLDWVYPKCWQSNCNKGPDSDMENFSKLLKVNCVGI